jgi:hypothetical protein
MNFFRLSQFTEKYLQGNSSLDDKTLQADVVESLETLTCTFRVFLEFLRVCGEYVHEFFSWIPVEILKEIISNVFM